MPFFAMIMVSLKRKEDRGALFLWTDGVVIGYNPEVVRESTLEEVIWGLCHLVMHLVFRHHLRRGKRDGYIWNIAANHINNHALEEAGLTAPLRFYKADPRFRGMAIEEVYQKMLSPQPLSPEEVRVRLSEEAAGPYIRPVIDQSTDRFLRSLAVSSSAISLSVSSPRSRTAASLLAKAS